MNLLRVGWPYNFFRCLCLLRRGSIDSVHPLDPVSTSVIAAPRRSLCALVLFAALLITSSWAEDWPQWRGPNRNGIASEKVSAAWPGAGPRILWRASVATAFSSFAISRGCVYTMGNSDQRDIIWCLDARTGREIWKHTYDSPLGPQYYEGGPGSTPTVDGDRVVTIGEWGDVFSRDAARGGVMWQRDLRHDGIKT